MGGGTADSLHPWQQVTIGSGLMLHAPLAVDVDLALLRAEFAALDAATGPEVRTDFNFDGSWTSICLIKHTPPDADGTLRAGAPTPSLAHMPSVRNLISRTGWTAVYAAIIRQPPRGTLPWHFDLQAIHLALARLLVPIYAPAAAVTLIGDERVAYPAGTGWTGDFNFPHQVENPSDEQRIILCIDAVCGPEVRRLLPAALGESAPLRHDLAQRACNELLAWRAERGISPGYRTGPN